MGCSKVQAGVTSTTQANAAVATTGTTAPPAISNSVCHPMAKGNAVQFNNCTFIQYNVVAHPGSGVPGNFPGVNGQANSTAQFNAQGGFTAQAHANFWGGVCQSQGVGGFSGGGNASANAQAQGSWQANGQVQSNGQAQGASQGSGGCAPYGGQPGTPAGYQANRANNNNNNGCGGSGNANGSSSGSFNASGSGNMNGSASASGGSTVQLKVDANGNISGKIDLKANGSASASVNNGTNTNSSSGASNTPALNDAMSRLQRKLFSSNIKDLKSALADKNLSDCEKKEFIHKAVLRFVLSQIAGKECVTPQERKEIAGNARKIKEALAKALGCETGAQKLLGSLKKALKGESDLLSALQSDAPKTAKADDLLAGLACDDNAAPATADESDRTEAFLKDFETVGEKKTDCGKGCDDNKFGLNQKHTDELLSADPRKKTDPKEAAAAAERERRAALPKVDIKLEYKSGSEPRIVKGQILEDTPKKIVFIDRCGSESTHYKGPDGRIYQNKSDVPAPPAK